MPQTARADRGLKPQARLQTAKYGFRRSNAAADRETRLRIAERAKESWSKAEKRRAAKRRQTPSTLQSGYVSVLVDKCQADRTADAGGARGEEGLMAMAQAGSCDDLRSESARVAKSMRSAGAGLARCALACARVAALVQLAGHGLLSSVSSSNVTSSGRGISPATYSWRAAQQQRPSATQHSISQTSGSCAANESGTASHPSASTSRPAAARNLILTLGVVVMVRPSS